MKKLTAAKALEMVYNLYVNISMNGKSPYGLSWNDIAAIDANSPPDSIGCQCGKIAQSMYLDGQDVGQLTKLGA